MRVHASVSDPDGYRRFLSIMETITVAYAQLLDRSSELAGLPQRSNAAVDALRADAAALDASSTVTRSADALASDVVPGEVADDAAAAWGVGYVLEGSALGSAVLLAELSNGPSRASPVRYLSLLAGDRAKRWPVFGHALNGCAEVDPNDVLRSAVSVFLRVEHELKLGTGPDGEEARTP